MNQVNWDYVILVSLKAAAHNTVHTPLHLGQPWPDPQLPQVHNGTGCNALHKMTAFKLLTKSKNYQVYMSHCNAGDKKSLEITRGVTGNILLKILMYVNV